MKCEIIIDPSCEERVVVYTKGESRVAQAIQKLVWENETEFLGYKNTEIVPLNPFDIYCVTVIDSRVYAVCEKENLLLKQRLYTLEEMLPDYFVKINQSCIANIKKIERFDTSISGTLKIRFKNGHTDFVSRRQLKSVKEKIGI